MKTKICGIYKITSPSGKVYIGQSIDIHKRWYSYRTLRCTSQPKIYNSLKCHGVENHNFKIIAFCSKDNLNDYELYYINLYRSYIDGIGLNCNKTSESKMKSYLLKNNIKRIENEKKERKKLYYKKIKLQRKEAEKVSIKFEYLKLIDDNLRWTSKLVGIMQLYSNPEPAPDEYIYPNPLPF